jgi:hypothetical protein
MERQEYTLYKKNSNSRVQIPIGIMFDFWNLKFKIKFEFGLNT